MKEPSSGEPIVKVRCAAEIGNTFARATKSRHTIFRSTNASRQTSPMRSPKSLPNFAASTRHGKNEWYRIRKREVRIWGIVILIVSTRDLRWFVMAGYLVAESHERPRWIDGSEFPWISNKVKK